MRQCITIEWATGYGLGAYSGGDAQEQEMWKAMETIDGCSEVRYNKQRELHWMVCLSRKGKVSAHILRIREQSQVRSF